MLPYFLAHYGPLAERIFLYDHDSDDAGPSIVSGHPKVTVRRFESPNESFVLDATALYNTVWTESRTSADWVIIVNVDELVHAPNLRRRLSRYRRRGVTHVQCYGFQMAAFALPKTRRDLVNVLRRGVRDPIFDKTAIIDPKAIASTNYLPGRHVCAPRPVAGQTLRQARGVRLHHYKYVDVDTAVDRQAALRARMRPGDVERGYGRHYQTTREEQRRMAMMLIADAVDVVKPEADGK